MTPKTLTCVLVDDEQTNLDVLVNYVNQIPYLVLKATFVKPLEALAYLLKTPTDLLITDINMPRLSGIDLYESVVCNEGLTQVIFISGHPDKMMEALQYCATDYLAKPVSIIRFEKAIQKALYFVSSPQKSYDDISNEVLEMALVNYSTLSEAEIKVLALIAEGSTINEIATKVFTSPRTVESHRLSIRKKLKLSHKYRLVDVAKYLTKVIK